MSIRLRLAALLVVGWVLPAAAAPVPNPNAKYDPPTAVGQVASGQRVLDEIKAFATALAPQFGDEFDRGLAGVLGEKGFAGIDLTKPIAAYAYLKPKLEHTYGVFVIPVTGEKEALDLLDRLQVGVEEEKGVKGKGLYRLRKRDLFAEEPAWRVRFHDGHAYLGVNVDPEELDVVKLVPMRHLHDDAEKDVLSAKLFLDRCPKEFKELADGVIAAGRSARDQLEQRPPPDMPRSWLPLAKEGLDWAERNLTAAFADGESLVYRMKADANELQLTPKAGSKLAGDVAAVKPAAGRFHQLTAKDSVAGVWLTLPSVPKPLREKAGPFVTELIQLASKDSAGGLMQPVLDELSKAVEAAVTSGDLDVGYAVGGPNKDGHYTAVAGVGVADPAALEAAVKKVVAALPKEFQDMVKLDAEKVGDLSVHVVTLPEVPEPAQKALGKKVEVRLAFGAKAVVVAAGPDGAAELKRAVALKPVAARAMDVRVDAEKMNKLATTLAGDAGVTQYTEVLLGNAPGIRSLLSLDVTGGKALTVSWSMARLGGSWVGVWVR